MSIACGVGSVVVIGCMRWVWKRCSYIGSDDSEAWPIATMEEFEPIPRICRVILAVYDPDPEHPKYPPSEHYRVNHDNIFKRVSYEETQGRSRPYLIYTDHENCEIFLAIRGLNLSKESHYKILLDNDLGKQMFDGGYVHHGLLKSAIWILNQESETLKGLWLENGKNYNMVFAGHSLGAGIAALLTVIVVNHLDRLGGIPRRKIRCYAMAPARCMSLNLAVKYANVIHSIVLQDDFLPRTPTPLEDIFESIFCLPCLMFCLCLSDTFIPEDRKLNDPRRLYAPGRIYHIVERKFCRCGRYPPEVRTAIPVDGRFEHIVLSCSATSDHAVIHITNETEKALHVLRENDGKTITTVPKVPKFERLQTIEKEHKDALERAISLNILHAAEASEEEESSEETNVEIKGSKDEDEAALRTKSEPNNARNNWDELVGKLFRKTNSGELTLDREAIVNK